MKTNRFILAALFISAAFSCQKEGFGGSETTRETEAATIVAGEMTKTSLNGNNVCWTSDDVIAVYDDFGYKNKFAIKDAEANYAAFSGEVTSGTTQIYAVYPYQLEGDISGSTINVTIPVDQTSKVGSFAEEHNISVAKGEKTPGVEAIQDVTFKNVASILKFTVPSYIEDVKSVTFSTSRAIAGPATVDASADAPVAVVGEGGSKSVTMTGSYTAGSQFMLVLSAGEINGFTVTVVTDKATWSISRDVNVTLAPGQYKNLGTLELEQVGVSATATHTYSGSTLKGTTVNVALMPTATLQYASDLKIEVRNAAGTVVRSASSNTLTSSVTLDETTSTSWPYLPQGTYTVSGSYKLGETVKTISASFVSPAPVINVTSKAYSSYTKYVARDASTANSCNAETIYNVTSASVSISDAILNNGNYSTLKSGYTFKLDGNATSTATFSGQAWGPHTVTASYRFDGVTDDDAVDCYITGLPYTLNVAKNDTVSPWVESGNVAWNNSDYNSAAIRIGYALGDDFNTGVSSMVKTFSIPGDIKVNATATGKVRGSNFIVDIETTGSIIVGNTTIGSTTEKGHTNTGSFFRPNYVDNVKDFSYSVTNIGMTYSNNTVKCNNSNSTNHASTYVESLTILYADK